MLKILVLIVALTGNSEKYQFVAVDASGHTVAPTGAHSTQETLPSGEVVNVGIVPLTKLLAINTTNFAITQQVKSEFPAYCTAFKPCQIIWQ